MSLSSERLVPSRPIRVPSDREITEVTQSEIKRLRELQTENRLTVAEAELLATLQHDCRIHEF